MDWLNVIDLGRCEYTPALELQKELVQRTAQGNDKRTHLLLVEHDPPVITLGRRGEAADLKLSPDELQRRGVEVVEIARGGQATWHGPGQLTAYVIARLGKNTRTLRWLIDALESAAADVLGRWDIDALSRENTAGLWVPGENGLPPAKIASIGIAVERWVSYHGLALNVNPSLEGFSWIVPCGEPDGRVTSMAEQIDGEIEVADVKPRLVEAIRERIGADSETV
jgi:lipoate-protein ligase B